MVRQSENIGFVRPEKQKEHLHFSTVNPGTKCAGYLTKTKITFEISPLLCVAGTVHATSYDANKGHRGRRSRATQTPTLWYWDGRSLETATLPTSLFGGFYRYKSRRSCCILLYTGATNGKRSSRSSLRVATPMWVGQFGFKCGHCQRIKRTLIRGLM